MFKSDSPKVATARLVMAKGWAHDAMTVKNRSSKSWGKKSLWRFEIPDVNQNFIMTFYTSWFCVARLILLRGLSSFQSWTMWIPLHAGCISWAYKALETWCMKKDGWESVQGSTVPHESNESAVSAKFPTSAAFKNCFRSSKAGEDLEALPPKGRFRSNGFKWR